MIKYITSLLIAMSIVPLSTLNTHAENTGWFKSHQGRSTIKNLSKQGQIPVTIMCKDSGKKSFSERDVLVKLVHRDNVPKKRWHVAVGTPAVKRVGRRLPKKGYKRVSSSSFTRKSGLTIRCGVWHKG